MVHTAVFGLLLALSSSIGVASSIEVRGIDNHADDRSGRDTRDGEGGGKAPIRLRKLHSSSSSSSSSSKTGKGRRSTKKSISTSSGKVGTDHSGKYHSSSSSTAKKGKSERRHPSPSRPLGDDSEDDGVTIYEDFVFTVRTICGERDDVAEEVEEALLSYFADETQDAACDSDQETVSVVLIEFEQAPICKPISESKSKSKSKFSSSKWDSSSRSGTRQLQDQGSNRDRDSNGRGNSRSRRCRRNNRRCGRRVLVSKEETPVVIHRDLGTSKSSSKGSKSKGSKSKGKGKGKGGSKSKSKGKGKGSPPKCSADLTTSFQDVGFDVSFAEIPIIEEVDCSSHSQECLHGSACCGKCGCRCVEPSQSLCETNDFCIGVARPFDAHFCKDFGDVSHCKKEHCYYSISS